MYYYFNALCHIKTTVKAITGFRMLMLKLLLIKITEIKKKPVKMENRFSFLIHPKTFVTSLILINY